MRMAPLLLIAVGLIIVFRAGIWNLGMDGQFLLAGAVVSGTAPLLEHHVPNTLNLIVMFAVGGLVGAGWTIVPAWLKARYELNEIITTLMMTFIGIGLAEILVKGPFQDPTTTTPQTRSLDFTALLPSIPGTRIHVGILVAVFAAVVVWFLMSRTAFGLRLQVLGSSMRSSSSRSCSPDCSSASPPRPRSSASGATSAPTTTRPSGCGSCPSSSWRAYTRSASSRTSSCFQSSPSEATTRRRTPG